jgi:SAM-dependent methyltransferase
MTGSWGFSTEIGRASGAGIGRDFRTAGRGGQRAKAGSKRGVLKTESIRTQRKPHVRHSCSYPRQGRIRQISRVPHCEQLCERGATVESTTYQLYFNVPIRLALGIHPPKRLLSGRTLGRQAEEIRWRKGRGDVVPSHELEGFGAWYAEKQGETGDPWHRTLIDPGLLACLGDLPKGTRGLDVGCGNGYLARRLARDGSRVVGVDASPELVEYARDRETAAPLGIAYHERDAADLAGLDDESFDLAVANMSLMDIDDAAGALREVGRVVVDGGRFVFSISHPCFDIDTRSAWVVELSSGGGDAVIYRKVTDYQRPHSDRFTWNLAPGEVAQTTGHHRPLGWYAHALRDTGWVIVDRVEPRPTDEYFGNRVQRAWLEEIPMHLVVNARREPRRRSMRSPPP